MTGAAIVILSSGLDSSVNLALAQDSLNVKLAITFDYGQRAAKKEIQRSAQLCSHYKIPHKVISIPWVGEFGKSALIDKTMSIPTSEVRIDDLKISVSTATKVWVPNRNGIFLNIVAGYAEASGCDFIIPGFNLEEAQTFPDNSKDFIQSLDRSFSFSTANQVKVKCFTIDMLKPQILKVAIDKKIPLEMLWPCYFDGDKWCGECESCQRMMRAFIANAQSAESYFQSKI